MLQCRSKQICFSLPSPADFGGGVSQLVNKCMLWKWSCYLYCTYHTSKNCWTEAPRRSSVFYQSEANFRKTGGRCRAVPDVYFWGYLFSFMLILRLKPASWNSTAVDNHEWEFCLRRRSIAKVFSYNCSFGCVCRCCIPECQEALFRDWEIKSSRDILRRFLNPRGPLRTPCNHESFRLIVFNQKFNKC